MSCYFRHMKDILEEVGVEVTTENKKEIDRVIHGLVDVEFKNCPSTWKALKAHIRVDEKTRTQFVKRLKQALTKSENLGG